MSVEAKATQPKALQVIEKYLRRDRIASLLDSKLRSAAFVQMRADISGFTPDEMTDLAARLLVGSARNTHAQIREAGTQMLRAVDLDKVEPRTLGSVYRGELIDPQQTVEGLSVLCDAGLIIAPCLLRDRDIVHQVKTAIRENPRHPKFALIMTLMSVTPDDAHTLHEVATLRNEEEKKDSEIAAILGIPEQRVGAYINILRVHGVVRDAAINFSAFAVTALTAQESVISKAISEGGPNRAEKREARLEVLLHIYNTMGIRELAAYFGVSTATVMLDLRILEERKLIPKRRGRRPQRSQ
jgi:hypothetical protein